MADSTKVDLNFTADVTVDWRRQNYTAGTSSQASNQGAFLGVGALEAVIAFPTINRELDITAYVKVLGGGGSSSDSSITRSARLSGFYDSRDYLLSRGNLAKDHFGIYEAFLSANFKTPGLTFSAGIFPQDLKVYPYHFNSSSCSVGDTVWTCSTGRANNFDSLVWPDLFTNHIGPGFSVEWVPPGMKELKLTVQTHTGLPPVNADNGDSDVPFKTWLTTAQIFWEKGDYKIGSLSALTSLAAFYSNYVPANPKSDNGEITSQTHGLGFYGRQVLDGYQLALGYGLNRNTISDSGLNIINLNQSVNVGVSRPFLHNRLIPTVNFSWMNSSTEQSSSLIKTKLDASEYVLDLSLTGVPTTKVPGLSLTLGWRALAADQTAQASLGTPSFNSALYFMGYYTKTFSWGG